MLKKSSEIINWDSVDAVIFDVDGTLYDQKRLRSIMVIKLAVYYFFRPWRLKELIAISHFRQIREMMAENGLKGNIEQKQYDLTSKNTDISDSVVKRCIEMWFIEKPLPYLKYCIFPDVINFFSVLSEHSIKVAFFSDYPVRDKIKALGLPDKVPMTCSTDKEIDIFKPAPTGLFYTINSLGVSAERCLYIGDREDRDGQCAKHAAVRYLLKKTKIVPNGFISYNVLINSFLHSKGIK